MPIVNQVHLFNINKYSTFRNNTWIHYPQRTELTLCIINKCEEEENSNSNSSSGSGMCIEVNIQWKGSRLDSHELFLSAKVTTTILKKAPCIGIKQANGNGKVLFRFQISLESDGEYDRCCQILEGLRLSSRRSEKQPCLETNCCTPESLFSQQLFLQLQNAVVNIPSQVEQSAQKHSSSLEQNTQNDSIPKHGKKQLTQETHNSLQIRHQSDMVHQAMVNNVDNQNNITTHPPKLPQYPTPTNDLVFYQNQMHNTSLISPLYPGPKIYNYLIEQQHHQQQQHQQHQQQQHQHQHQQQQPTFFNIQNPPKYSNSSNSPMTSQIVPHTSLQQYQYPFSLYPTIPPPLQQIPPSPPSPPPPPKTAKLHYLQTDTHLYHSYPVSANIYPSITHETNPQSSLQNLNLQNTSRPKPMSMPTLHIDHTATPSSTTQQTDTGLQINHQSKSSLPNSILDQENGTDSIRESTTESYQLTPKQSTWHNLEEYKLMTDSELRAAIHKKCQLKEFRDFVKRLDRIIEKF